MEREHDSAAGPRRLIDTHVKTRFVAALRRGESRESAAAAVGFPLGSLYNARASDPLFRHAWEWAMDLYAWYLKVGEPLPPGGDDDTIRIAPANRRPLQRRRMNWVKFNEARQQIFLDHFAATADSAAAAAKAGVSESTVNVHARRHPEFAAVRAEALDHAVARLEAESVRQRLAVQRRLSENLEPEGEMAQEFERVMKHLARWDRKGGGVGPRPRPPVESQAWTFDQAIAALDKRLRALGYIKPGDGPDPPEGKR
jgi:DNA-binding transcriptional regulator YdaS (Cro superfamily)